MFASPAPSQAEDTKPGARRGDTAEAPARVVSGPCGTYGVILPICFIKTKPRSSSKVIHHSTLRYEACLRRGFSPWKAKKEGCCKDCNFSHRRVFLGCQQMRGILLVAMHHQGKQVPVTRFLGTRPDEIRMSEDQLAKSILWLRPGRDRPWTLEELIEQTSRDRRTGR
jgi:hypothetical protein